MRTIIHPAPNGLRRINRFGCLPLSRWDVDDVRTAVSAIAARSTPCSRFTTTAGEPE